MKLKGKVYKTVVRPVMLYGAETWATTRGQEARLEVNEMRMLRWMCGVTGGIRSEMNTSEGQQESCKRPKNLQKTTEVIRPCEENENGARSEKNVRCGDTGEKKKRTAKPTMERCMQERHDRSGSERGQHDKQGRMEKKLISYTGDPR